jgi:AcrR family transcriptional regulator
VRQVAASANVVAMVERGTREALIEEGALLFARRGVNGVAVRQLHDAIGTRNTSALQYYFGDTGGLVTEILNIHLNAVEARRAALVARIAAEGRSGDVRALVHALAAPMAEDLATPLGRAHLRIVAQMSHPSLAYARPFQVVAAPAGAAVVRWLREALSGLPETLRTERLVVLRAQLIMQFADRAQLLDEPPVEGELVPTAVFLENLLDWMVAGLTVEPSPATVGAMGPQGGRRPPSTRRRR